MKKELKCTFIFFWALMNAKKEPPGFFFQLFSDSNNVKRLLSTCLFDLVKLNEMTSTLYNFNPFRDWDILFTKKEHLSQTWLRSFLRYHFTLFRTWATNLRKMTYGVFFFSLFQTLEIWKRIGLSLSLSSLKTENSNGLVDHGKNHVSFITRLIKLLDSDTLFARRVEL